MNQRAQGYWVVMASLFVAAVLAVLPLPPWLAWGRPEWLALVLIYWCIALPQRIGVVVALLSGLAMDVLEGAVLGQNAFALSVLALLSVALYQRLRVFSLWQQAGIVFLLIGIHQLICQWVQNLQGIGERSLLFLLPALTSALLWPLVLFLLRGLRRHFRVA
ncbi:rod shape-determining protein MreD [Parahaliea sp. F7430]|uniref:Rod shape-determining protein MreD n=1 Tax=Sediminihaliea albiluteola TaxID=2758564 RepID=A0A7W2TW22_9GAMM|nr:rod shape-determining protein MreD [Sediminihaliea albiluteola]MBA6413005.1 rod shape-determining protein MreD [Sediminihaliea albiluteola]